MDLKLIQSLVKQNQSKIVFLIMDGVGGIPRDEDGKTELEAALLPI